MRLIDADEVLRRCAIGKMVSRYGVELFDALIEAVDSTPTAYDVDKVVGQLEESKCNKPTDFIFFGKNLAFDEAIEIVKVGGKE